MKLRHLFDFAPTAENPRNSEGAFLPLRDGRLLFVYSRFCAGDADDAGADISAVIIQNGAPDAPRVIVRAADEGARNLMSVSLMRMQNGDIGLFYLRREGETRMYMDIRRSADEGCTWSSPVCCTPREGYYVINNDRAVRLADGRIVLPAAEHVKMKLLNGGVHMDSRAEAVFFFSEDDGRSWREGPARCALGSAPYTRCGLQEPGLIELYPGILWAWARTDLGCQYQMISIDGGMTFTPAAPSRFSSPQSPLSMKRLKGGALLAVYNPVPTYNGRAERFDMAWTGGRTPLVFALSHDNGRSFDPPVTLESDEMSGYCYTAICETEEGVYLGYCAGSVSDRSCLKRLRVSLVTFGADEACGVSGLNEE